MDDKEASNVTVTVLAAIMESRNAYFWWLIMDFTPIPDETAVSLNNLFVGAPIDYIYPLPH